MTENEQDTKEIKNMLYEKNIKQISAENFLSQKGHGYVEAFDR